MKHYKPQEAADLLQISAKTLSKWIDTGKMNGFRIPGSRHRRVPAQSLIEYFQERNLPLPKELQDKSSIRCSSCNQLLPK